MEIPMPVIIGVVAAIVVVPIALIQRRRANKNRADSAQKETQGPGAE